MRTQINCGPVLIGMRGAGKSTAAEFAAKMLKMDHIDSDKAIEHSTGQTIAEIFAKCGQAGFRSIERNIVLGLLERKLAVLSLGGGAVLDEDVRTKLMTRPTIWLDAKTAVLARRIQGSDRPSLTGQNIEHELDSVLEQRRRFYSECASVRIDTTLLTPEQTASEIAAHWTAYTKQEVRGNGF